MSAAVKYRLEAYSAKYRDVYRVDILEEGYTGDVRRKNIGAGKIHLKKSEGIIQSTFLSMSIQSDFNFEFLGFFQYNNRKYPVRLYRNDVHIWSGYITPESYQEPYVNPPYDVEVIATDGLAMLDNYTFEAEGNFITRIQAIVLCLANLGLSLEYEIAVDLIAENMDATRSMLEQTYFLPYIFNGEKCSDVLEQILPYGCVLTQKNNRWVIRRPLDDSEKTHLVYASNGVYLGTTPGESLLQMGAYSEAGIWPHPSSMMTMEHAVGKATLNQNYGVRKSMLKNHDFSAGNFSFWGWYGKGNLEVRYNGTNHFAWLPGFALTSDPELNEEYIHQQIDVEHAAGGGFVFRFKYCHVGGEYKDYAQTEYKGPLNVYLKAFIVLESTAPLGVTYYLTESGWTTTPTKFKIQVQTKQIIDWGTLEVITDYIIADGTLHVYLYKVPFNPINSKFTVNGSAYTDVELFTVNKDEYKNSKIEFDVRENAPENIEIEMKPLDLPDVRNSSLLFDNGNFYYYNNKYRVTQLWKENSGNLIPLTELLKNQVRRYFGNPRQIISGALWRGAGLHLNSIAQHRLNYGRKFYASYGSWDILGDAWDIVWLEVPATATGNPPPDAEYPTGTDWIVEEGIWDDGGTIWHDDERWEDTDINKIIVNVNGIGLHDITHVIQPGDIIQLFTGYYDGMLFNDSTHVTFPYTYNTGLLGYRVSENAPFSYHAELRLLRPFDDEAGTETIIVKLIVTL